VTRSLRVLIVEDEVLVASYVADLLDEWGHEVVAVCATGQEAIQRLGCGRIDVAILDIKLKGSLTGLDVAREACERAIAHVFLSGSGDPATRTAALATHPLAFLQKPLHQEKFKSVLAAAAAKEVKI
jgi:CheY-like chemotaxis protein